MRAPPAPPPAVSAPAVDHYENFPVASWLCPAALRPAVAALYWYARTADDIADEGDARADERLADLAAYRSDLDALFAGTTPSGRWPAVFGPLRAAIARDGLPHKPLADLLDAFAQDVRKTAEGAGYADRAELLDYCARSAAPVGRLMLHLYGVQDDRALAHSDAICSALQLINFWQDLSVDLPRARYYLPQDRCAHHGTTQQAPTRALVAEQVRWARELMHSGAPLVHRVPGRMGWELRLVVQGGLRILDKIESMDCATWQARPKLRPWDGVVMFWRSLWM
ncbi:squalene synthase HpnC [Pseudorhodoferax sp. Leaf267]|uniref:squalene synthase HpnC n=1 Tax=Pseudorhodoferax sp. Leaf267 TaxID=1736316 RepID=UPI000B0F3DA6|nr:squalene synthase HpnC [Pseudorhodoferax sp. Leaf267]